MKKMYQKKKNIRLIIYLFQTLIIKKYILEINFI
jgi:hypothetical protein